MGVPYERIEDLRDFLAGAGLETGGTGSKVRPVVACKGTTCQYGQLDSYSLSEKYMNVSITVIMRSSFLTNSRLRSADAPTIV